MMIRATLAALLILLAFSGGIQAQADDAPPYLYYYSRLLGGIVIERADGTDSRIIGQDVIPPNLSGLAGPGWSASGKYFAAYGNSVYLIKLEGEHRNGWGYPIARTYLLQWSPTGEDILLLAGSFPGSEFDNLGAFVWLINPRTSEIMAEFGLVAYAIPFQMSNVNWDIPHQQIRFYISTDTDQTDHPPAFHVTMHLDGTVLREPVAPEAFQAMRVRPNATQEAVQYDDLYHGRDHSPSGRYETSGLLPTTLHDLQTGQQVELPIPLQARMCSHYQWSRDERYLLALGGTQVLSDYGCGRTDVGVTDAQGKLWRELSVCSDYGDNPACAGWLPEQVDVNALPPGLPETPQLEPIRIDYDRSQFNEGINMLAANRLELRCTGDYGADIVNTKTLQSIYSLAEMPCPYTYTVDSPLDHGVEVAVAQDSAHGLLALFTHPDWGDKGVSIWKRHGEVYEQILRLNSWGYKLEFTDGGKYLRALNYNGWKVYAVDDILASAKVPEAS